MRRHMPTMFQALKVFKDSSTKAHIKRNKCDKKEVTEAIEVKVLKSKHIGTQLKGTEIK
jgi:hypothetical protein